MTTDQTYRVVRPIAEGGMGRVELAVRQEGNFRRVFALKRLKGALEEDPAAQEMFMEEGRLAGLLRHPNVVSVLDVGRDERGAYLVMDFIEGLSVSKLVTAAGRAGRMVPVQVVVRVMLDVIRGLDAAHGLSSHDGTPLDLVHRDISPQNILIGYDGVARLTDFGIAKALGRGSDTTTGILKGKAGYMSPEQFRFQEPDQRSDLFSFGVVLVEMLIGRRVYKSDSLAGSARRVLEEPPPDVGDIRADIPPALIELCFKLLAKGADHRPASARDVGRSLAGVLNDLVSEEGVLEVRDYLEAHHEAERIALKNELAGVWNVFDSIAPQPVQGGKRRIWLGVAAAGMLAITAGVLFANGGDEGDEGDFDEQEQAVSSPEVHTPDPPQPPASAPAEVEPQATAVPVAPPVANAPEASDPPRMSMRRRPRMSSSMTSTPPDMGRLMREFDQ